MWPGIYSINLDQDEDADKAIEDFKMGQSVVIYAYNGQQ